jgi:hypothetical protein
LDVELESMGSVQPDAYRRIWGAWRREQPFTGMQPAKIEACAFHKGRSLVVEWSWKAKR